MSTLRGRIDAIEKGVGGSPQRPVVLFGGDQIDEDVRALLTQNGIGRDAHYVMFGTICLDRENNPVANQPTLRIGSV